MMSLTTEKVVIIPLKKWPDVDAGCYSNEP